MTAMTQDEIETLMVVLASDDGALLPGDLGDVLATCAPPRFGVETAERLYELGRRRALPLIRAGALSRDGYAKPIRVTEKGRIAATLLMARDPALRFAFFDEGAD